MKYRKLGKSGIEASVVGFGSWAIGGWMWGGITDEREAIGAIHAAIDSGMNLIDTAPMYGFGASEKTVGKAISDRRDKVVLATKCGLIWHEERGDFHCFTDEKHPSKDGKIKISRCLAPDVIRYEVEESLILFQDLDCGPFCESICSVTEGYQGNDFSHCGIIVKTTNGWGMLEAVSKGVVITPLDTVLNRATLDSTYFFGRINDTAIAIDAALARAHKLIGANYDVVFDINNDDYYCSEVLYKAFLKEGQPIFTTPPMTYKMAGTDKLDPIWIEYFETLEAKIPEGEPGLNPGGVSLSKYLDIFEVTSSPL